MKLSPGVWWFLLLAKDLIPQLQVVGAQGALSFDSITVRILISMFLCVCSQPPVREGPVTRSASRAASLHSLSDASSDSFNHSPGEMHTGSFSSCPCFLSYFMVNLTKDTLCFQSMDVFIKHRQVFRPHCLPLLAYCVGVCFSKYACMHMFAHSRC